MSGPWLLALALIPLAGEPFVTLHGVNGQPFYVNPHQITSLREPVGNDRNHFPRGTRCVVSETDGKFVPVRESCAEVRDLVTHQK